MSDPSVAAGSAVPRRRYLLFTSIAVVGVLADLATKSWIFGRMWPPPVSRRDPDWLWTGYAGFEISLNEGALFGLGQGWVVGFVILSIVAAIGILYWLFVLGEARDLWLTIALGGITAGIFGNLYDRLGLHGLVYPPNYRGHEAGEPVYAVRDWILLQWSDTARWPNFNIADSLLVCGAIILLLHTVLVRKSDDGEETQRVRRAPSN